MGGSSTQNRTLSNAGRFAGFSPSSSSDGAGSQPLWGVMLDCVIFSIKSWMHNTGCCARAKHDCLRAPFFEATTACKWLAAAGALREGAAAWLAPRCPGRSPVAQALRGPCGRRQWYLAHP